MIYLNRFYVGLLVFGLLLVTSCGEATKMLKSKDIKEQYDFAEISKILDMNETAIRVALSRARKTIREKLTKTHSYGVK